MFGPRLGKDGTVPVGKKVTFPTTVEGSAAGGNLKSLTVYASYDGKTFKKVPVRGGRITLPNPKKGKSVALRAEITDKKGNTSQVAVYDAYFGK
ncbi:hypothetical protein GTY75_31395 [Streptomyces sp. SID8381]|uniref:hypothetical protein n=1 Tax=unclassified Streptomyces TaxID=2593676 RepID=UPI0003A99AFE|nr:MULTISPECIES: hypothetical protein [unclassified Streptomyces]MYX31074.1 hypothetical protein [Streptomyces sp. SID8381]